MFNAKIVQPYKISIHSLTFEIISGDLHSWNVKPMFTQFTIIAGQLTSRNFFALMNKLEQILIITIE